MCQASDVLRAASGGSGSQDSALGAYAPPSAVVRRAPHYLADRDVSRLVILGTGGGSNPKSTRFGYANAVVVGEHAYLVDCGEGVNYQAWKAGIVTNRDRQKPGGATLRSVVITHLHSDHVIDYANVFLGFWPQHDIDVYGPGRAGMPIPTYPPGRVQEFCFPENPTPGLTDMTERLFQAFAYNINVRMADENRGDVVARVHTNDIGYASNDYAPHIDLATLGIAASGASIEAAAPPMEPFVVRPADDAGVTISAILVQHAPVFPALGYRIDTPHGSVAFSGDTGPCDNVVRLARDADVLVHEVIDLEFVSRRVAKLPNRDAIISHLVASHTSPEDAGRIATRAGVKTLVLSHLVPGDDEFSTDEWEARVRPHFDGEVVCGVELDEFSLARRSPSPGSDANGLGASGSGANDSGAVAS